MRRANYAKIWIGDYIARVGQAHPGEEDVVGEFGWGREAVHEVDVPNRELLLEFCVGTGMLVANTFYNESLDKKVTFRESGVLPLAPIDLTTHNILDLLLCEPCMLDTIDNVQSHRHAALATDHYLVTFDMAVRIPPERQNQNQACDVNALDKDHIREQFIQTFMANTMATDSVEGRWANAKEAVESAKAELPRRERTTKQPWVTQRTLDLIAERSIARSQNNKVWRNIC